MKTLSEDLKEYLEGDARSYKIRVLVDSEDISEDVETVSYTQVLGYKVIGNVATTTIKLNIFGNIDLLDKDIDVYLLTDGIHETYLGNFHVIKAEKENKISDITSVEAVDHGYRFNQKYNLYVETPLTLKEYLDLVLEKVDLELENEEIINGSYLIEKEPFFDNTYKEVVQSIAEVAASNVIVTAENKVRFIPLKTEVDFVITNEELFEHEKEKVEVGNYNTVTASRIVASDLTTTEDVFFPEELEEIRHDLKLLENQIIDNNRIDALPEILTAIEGFNYTPVSLESILIPVLEVGDLIEVEDHEGNFNTFIQELYFNINSGLCNISSFGQSVPETDYKAATVRDKRKLTEIKVNKLEGQIKSTAEKTDELESQVSEVTQTAEGLTATVTENITDLQEKIAELGLTQDELELIFKLQNGNNLIKNSAMKNGTEYWFKSEGEELEGFYPQENDISRRSTVSNSLITVDGGNFGDYEFRRGMTEEIPLVKEELNLGLKLENAVKSGAVKIRLIFVNEAFGEPVKVIEKILTPDDNNALSDLNVQSEIPETDYVHVCIELQPITEFGRGTELPKEAEKGDYFVLEGQSDPNNNMVHRAKFNGEDFDSWENIGYPSLAVTDKIPISGTFQFADLKLQYGIGGSLWSGYPDEIYGKNVKFDATGLKIFSGQNQMYINVNEIIATFSNQEIFKITEQLTKLKYLVAERATIAGINFKIQKIGGKDYTIIY